MQHAFIIAIFAIASAVLLQHFTPTLSEWLIHLPSKFAADREARRAQELSSSNDSVAFVAHHRDVGATAQMQRASLDDGVVTTEMPGGQLDLLVWWHAPFLSSGGYASEAIAFALGLSKCNAMKAGGLRISQHGDGINANVIERMDVHTRSALSKLLRPHTFEAPLVVICHSTPMAWSLPKPLFQTSPCPPLSVSANESYLIGRTMFETDTLDEEWVRRCNMMDEVWVPTAFHKGVFQRSGVAANKLTVIPEPVDTAFFDPAGAEALQLPQGQSVFGRSVDKQEAKMYYNFVSVFKWEERKAWKLLLEAYLREFSQPPQRPYHSGKFEGFRPDRRPVALYILTQPFHSGRDFQSKIHRWAEEHLGDLGTPARRTALPVVYVTTSHLSDKELRGFYRSADAFVLPSRGEGWGRPHCEAMSMGLPVIATNWSGPTAFMTDKNSYPISISGLVTADSGNDHMWAEPSLQHMQHLMRYVVSNPADSRAVGRRARDDMIRYYAPDVVAEVVIAQLRTIRFMLNARTVAN